MARVEDLKKKYTDEWLSLSPEERKRRKAAWRKEADSVKPEVVATDHIESLSFWQRVKLVFKVN